MEPKFSAIEGNKVFIQGDLDVYTVGDILQQGQRLIRANKTLDTIDFSQVNKIDSAGLALVIEFIRLAKQHKLELHFQNIPARMRALSEIYGLEGILPENVFQSS